MSRARAAHLVFVLACAGACAPAAPAPPVPRLEPEIVVPPPRGYASVLIEGVPHVRQKPDFCGEACVAMALGRLGRVVDQDRVFDLSGVDPSLGRGLVTHELDRTLRRLGFDTGLVWYAIRPATAGAELSGQFEAMHADLRAGIPSIVCMHYDAAPRSTEHFRLVVGYDASADEVLYHEPAADDGAYRRMSRAVFLKLWPLKPSPEAWAAVRLRLAPTGAGVSVAARDAASGPSPADYAQHVLALRRKLGRRARDFTVVVERPFVVLGDGDAASVRAHAEHTVRWATVRLKQAYFAKEPQKILDVWLFRDRASYESNVLALYDERPPTRFGYYSAKHGALLMNISTGRGTLVHELVHPFVEADFPGAPPWLNEGLGSLYEQCGEEHGKIWGYTNWRLTSLQRAIKEKKVPPFEKLLGEDASTFYDEDPGTNYAEARYLLHYLQERGLLARFYREFRGARDQDPTGIETLRRVLGKADLEAFQREWEAYVSELVFPRTLEVLNPW